MLSLHIIYTEQVCTAVGIPNRSRQLRNSKPNKNSLSTRRRPQRQEYFPQYLNEMGIKQVKLGIHILQNLFS